MDSPNDSLSERIAALDRLSRQMSLIRVDLLHDPEIVKQYQTSEGLFTRTPGSARSANEINQATCTGFALVFGLNSGVFERCDGLTRFQLLDAKGVVAARDALGRVLLKHRGGEVSDVADLPNQYDSAIQLAGFLAASRLSKEPPDMTATKPACQAIVGFLMNLIRRTHGFVPNLGEGSIPSPYLTFWAATALAEYVRCASLLKLSEADVSPVHEALQTITAWSESVVATHATNHHAKFSDRFDVAELLCAAQARLAAAVPTVAPIPPIVDHAIAIALNHYMPSGCFVPSWPVLADRTNNFSLQCPTVELLAPLLWSAGPSLRRMSDALMPAAVWLHANRRSVGGWTAENLGHQGAPTVFMTVAALAVLAGLTAVFEDALDTEARELLRVEPFVRSEKDGAIPYPSNLEPIITKRLLKEIRQTPRPPSTPYSMVLFGPPGTSKTVVTKRLAQDLQWPIKILNQSEFLRRGLDNIDAEADRIFRLLAHLQNVVVVFDEVEELVRAREGEPDKTSRLLTNAMLPRINDLREAKRIFFIFVTNHLDSIDAAILRRGRFDIVQAVMPPDEATRKAILDGLLKKVGASDRVREALHDMPGLTDNFCYGHLESLVYNVVRAGDDGEEKLSKVAIEEMKRIQKQLKRQDLEDFKKKEEEYSRS